MSDPVTNLEIEDVLSSIRRLVSEEGRSTARSEVAEPAPSTDRLVLTPALRVADPQEGEDTDTSPLSTPAEDIEQDAEGLRDEPWTVPDATLYEAAQAAGELPADAVEEDQSDSWSAQPETKLDVGAESEVEAFGLSAFEIKDGEKAETASEHTVEDPHQDPSDAALELPELGASLSAKIQALEAAIGQTPDQWEPDGESDEAYSGTRIETIEWQDHEPDLGVSRTEGPSEDSDETAPDDVVSTVGPTPVDEVAVSSLQEEDAPALETDVVLGDDTVLDEESLRELVADIVREELQGALGERITRNVRKLVRREIHRALTAQELE